MTGGSGTRDAARKLGTSFGPGNEKVELRIHPLHRGCASSLARSQLHFKLGVAFPGRASELLSLSLSPSVYVFPRECVRVGTVVGGGGWSEGGGGSPHSREAVEHATKWNQAQLRSGR